MSVVYIDVVIIYVTDTVASVLFVCQQSVYVVFQARIRQDWLFLSQSSQEGGSQEVPASAFQSGQRHQRLCKFLVSV